jgi:tripartite-type tricarboxylate transporter receptor subunit TctC
MVVSIGSRFRVAGMLSRGAPGRNCRSIAVALVATAMSSPDTASAQNYPSRPIRLLTSGVGGNGDVTARLVANGLTPRLGQQLIVDNRPSGFTSSEIASRAIPDGYTLLVLGTTHWMSPLVRRVPYDPDKDFSPITMVSNTPNVLIVTPSLPLTSVGDLISLAKAKPGVLNYGASGVGSSNHLAAELFKYMTGVDIVHVPYKSNVAGMADLMAGQIQIAFPTGAAAAPLVKSGKVKALAVSGARPSASFPGLPTIAESVPGYESGSPIAVFAPAKTPEAAIKRLHAEIVSVLQDPVVRKRLQAFGAEPVGSTPAETRAKIKAEVERMGKVIKAAGIRVE